jgi:hypothetical protein
MVKLLLTLLLTTVCAMPHDFHASITQIEYNPTSGRLELAVKIFTDDLEAAIQPAGKDPLRLATSHESSLSNDLIGDYVIRHLRVKVDGMATVLAFIGKEHEADATWCFLETGPVNDFRKLEIINTLLFSQFDDQVNIIHLKKDGRTKAKMTNAAQRTVTF